MLLLLLFSFLLGICLIVNSCEIEKIDVPKNQRFQVINMTIPPIEFRVASPISVNNSNELIEKMGEDIVNFDFIIWYFKWLKHRAHGETIDLYCIDTSAGVGYYSILLATNHCKVKIFAAERNMIDVAKVSVQLNHLEHQVTLHRLPDSDSEKKAHYNTTSEGSLLDCLTTDMTPSYALARIDSIGHEIRILQEMSHLIKNNSIEAISIHFHPAYWERMQISISEGLNVLNTLFNKRYFCYLVMSYTTTCPLSIHPDTSEHDILLSTGASMKYISWKKFEEVIQAMTKHHANCMFYFFRHPHSLLQRMKAFPYVNTLEGKVVTVKSTEPWSAQSGPKRVFYLLQRGIRHRIPDEVTVQHYVQLINQQQQQQQQQQVQQKKVMIGRAVQEIEKTRLENILEHLYCPFKQMRRKNRRKKETDCEKTC